ncbi:von Willebrand factor A domain-containing protein 5A-like isoform X2 [Dendropsophus ebraccatus]|uniref:von Willebrand factor A domain-containing protein 5A-like isoform X2 n=1 Tax=Dendropsophus ebraccatus TaxID=150705 RepID=UPI003831F966
MPAFRPCCGLIIADSRKLVPLQGISVDVQVKGFVADVSATLKYENEEAKAVEAIFVFPMDQDSAVYTFKAKVGGKTIVADLQEKQQAHQTYDAAICQGQQAFLLEENEDSSDIFTCRVGNLPPYQVAEVTIKYVQELPVEADEAIRFVLPAVLNPRYTPTDHLLSVTATRPQLPIGRIPYTLSVSAHFQSAYGITKIESNCSISPVEYTDEGKTSAKLSLAEGHRFDRDVELLVYYTEMSRPSAAVEAGIDSGLAEQGSFMSNPIVMLSLFPRFPTQQEEATGGEFIFLVDQSGSMNSPINSELNAPLRIQSAKETLILLLKSLPLGCYFNIFGFGSNFASFFMESLEYTQESMEDAVKKVTGMNANFGGTEILLPLRKIFSTGKSERPRQVFIFTDGEVGNTKEVIREVEKNSHNHRCFTFGIGEGASTSLIKGMARAGGGAYDFITGKDRMQSKVLKAMRLALQPSVTDISLTWDLPTGLEAAVLSRVPTSIFQGQRAIIYSQLQGNMVKDCAAGQVSLQYRLRGELIVNTYRFPLNLQNVHRPTIHRLAAKSLISKLEYGMDSGSEEVKKRILETSLQSGVISSLTAFVAVDKDTKNLVEGLPVRWDIPAPAFGLMNSWMGTGGFSFGRAPSSGTLFGYAPSSGTAFSFGGAPPSGLCYPSAQCSTASGTSVFGSAPSSVTPACFTASTSGTMGFGSAPPSGTLFGSTFSFGSAGTMAFGSAPSSGSHPAQEEIPAHMRLIFLQKADGSWSPSPELAAVLGISEEDLEAKNPDQGVDSSVWATLLAVIWLHSNCSEQKDEWELLSRKAVTWIKSKADPSWSQWVRAGIQLLKTTVDLPDLGFLA